MPSSPELVVNDKMELPLPSPPELVDKDKKEPVLPCPMDPDEDPDITITFSCEADLVTISQLPSIATLDPAVMAGEFYNSWLRAPTSAYHPYVPLVAPM